MPPEAGKVVYLQGPLQCFLMISPSSLACQEVARCQTGGLSRLPAAGSAYPSALPEACQTDCSRLTPLGPLIRKASYLSLRRAFRLVSEGHKDSLTKVESHALLSVMPVHSTLPLRPMLAVEALPFDLFRDRKYPTSEPLNGTSGPGPEGVA